ncbi:50S ribosomal protein L16 [Mycoplasma putrefaciens]|uniref:Large ribosomal subunit protein uL16 n=2 Tax=Mycoplasma putrefaciens TaxID=2123 RepID=M9WI08_9MOLU|nr:50S ribosomal protein L16 [Mycoplasma putrefaciens]AEM68544.1 ribosomal protein L16 [Mycoplasma putrefaciens KS1]AGJ90994.1 50S ribosomal protein L16 [Mycoplasma putrefaciens Mput9231]
MLMPKRTKYRKPHRVSYQGKAKGAKEINFGEFGLMALDGAWIDNHQIEAARIAMTRYMRRDGKIWMRIYPHMSMSKKPAEVRMGSGKGNPEKWVAVVKKGTIMFEIAQVNEEVAREALRLAAHKLPIRCKFVKRGDN